MAAAAPPAPVYLNPLQGHLLQAGEPAPTPATPTAPSTPLVQTPVQSPQTPTPVEPKPPSMAPGLGTPGGAPVTAPKEQQPPDWPDKPIATKTDKGPPSDWPDKPVEAKPPPVEAKAAPPADWPDKPVEQPQAPVTPKPVQQGPPADAAPVPKEPVAPQPPEVQQPEQLPQQPPTSAKMLWNNRLVERPVLPPGYHWSGESGGKNPEDNLIVDDQDRTVEKWDDLLRNAYQKSDKAPTLSIQLPAPTGQDQTPTTINGNRLYGTSTVFGLNYDRSIDPDDNGRGFFGGINTRNPNLRAVAVPVDVLEGTFGKFTQKNAQGGYDALNTPEAKAIIAKIRSAHVELPDPNGKIHKFPIVDIQGSLKGHPGKVLDFTYGAAHEMGFTDNHAVSYQIIGGDGKPYPIPEIELTGGDKGVAPGVGAAQVGSIGFMPVVPTHGPSGSARRSGQYELPGGAGGGGGGGGGSAPAGGGASVNLGADLGALAGAGLVGAALGSRGAAAQPVQPQQGPTQQEESPVSSLMRLANMYGGGSEAPPPMKQANVLGVTTVGGPPPAPGLPSAPQAQLGAGPKALPAPSAAPDPLVIKGLMKRGFTREQAIAFASKATVSKPGAPAKAPPPPAPSATLGTGIISQAQRSAQAQQPPPPAPAKATVPQPQKQKLTRFQRSEQAMRQMIAEREAKIAGVSPSEATPFEGQRPGSTFGVPNPAGSEAITKWPRLVDQAKQHAAILSPDDPRVKKQKDNMIKGEHFVGGDPFHEQLLSGLPHGKQGRQGQILAQAEQAIGEKQPLHISYISAPAEAALHPTRESRTIQYEEHSPEARLMGTTEGQLVGHSMIPVSVGISPSRKASEPHQGYIQGISTNVLANNFQYVVKKLAEMGQKSPYEKLGAKFTNDLEGYLSNLNAGHTGTGRGHAVGTPEYPNEPDENHVPYHLTRREADFLNTVINNTAAFAKHEDGQALRRLAEANGTLITPEGETNRMRHEIEQHEPGWRSKVLEPSIRTFKTGLIHEVHPNEEHMPATIRPGREYQDLTKAIQRTSERGRPDVGLATSPRSQPIAAVPRDLAHNAKINEIEREFSEDKINEEEARHRLHAIGENPEEYRFVGGSGGLITPYEDDPEAISESEHAAMKDSLRKAWISGKMDVENYRRKVAEIPLPTKPSRPKPVSEEEKEAPAQVSKREAKPEASKQPELMHEPAKSETSEMGIALRQKLQKTFGDDTGNFLQLLGVTKDWDEAREALDQFKSGAFDKHVGTYEEEAHKKIAEGPKAMAAWIKRNDILPRRKNGKKFSGNASQLLRVLHGAPKTEQKEEQEAA